MALRLLLMHVDVVVLSSDENVTVCNGDGNDDDKDKDKDKDKENRTQPGHDWSRAEAASVPPSQGKNSPPVGVQFAQNRPRRWDREKKGGKKGGEKMEQQHQ